MEKSPENLLTYKGEFFKPPDGINFLNYLDESVPIYKGHGVIKEQRFIVLHENAGSSNVESMHKWLTKKEFGYHLVIHPNGMVTQHADLNTKLWHGGRANKFGVGMCIVNPYYPSNLKTMDFLKGYTVGWAEWWTHQKDKSAPFYVRPTDAQMKTVSEMVPFVSNVLSIDNQFPTADLCRTKRKIGNWKLFGKKRSSGIIAHRDYSKHADGRFILDHLILVETLKNFRKERS